MRGQAGNGDAASGQSPGEVGEGERAHPARRRGGEERDRRTGAAQGAGELGVGGAQPRGGAERDDQDVHGRGVRERHGLHCPGRRARAHDGRDGEGGPPIKLLGIGAHQVTAPLVGSGRRALKPGVRCRAIGWIGGV